MQAAALNGRDALFATGRLLPPRGARPGDVHLGCEGAGIVTAVGDDVTGILPGDRVAGITQGGWLASHINLRADQVVKLPEQVTFAAAASLLIAQLTTHHVLGHLAGLGPGDSVLILGGSDGTGLAAIDFARRAGSRVIVGAPTPALRALLDLPGVDHVVDSGAPGFAAEVRQVTQGGVDVVLNLSSLTADLRQRALDLLAPGGISSTSDRSPRHHRRRCTCRPWTATPPFTPSMSSAGLSSLPSRWIAACRTCRR
ncbi:zinc-binding dehydrogenase [Streptomyces sirii]|uniref:zinc-binding dehydrogenase n=1 Tax=Streptomyces sirii TaxID=3127701 RepID=UPI003D36C216